MNWRSATYLQLMDIAYIDTEAPIEWRIAAGAELKRRARVNLLLGGNFIEHSSTP